MRDMCCESLGGKAQIIHSTDLKFRHKPSVVDTISERWMGKVDVIDWHPALGEGLVNLGCITAQKHKMSRWPPR